MVKKKGVNKNQGENLVNRYEKALDAEASLSFLLPTKETNWAKDVRTRNFYFSSLFGCKTGSLSDEIVDILGASWRFLNEGLLDQPGSFFLPSPSQELCKAFEERQDEINVRYVNDVLGVQEKVFDRISKSSFSSKVIRHVLDLVLNRLEALKRITKGEVEKNNQFNLLSARAFLYRGAIIRTKGFTIPAKKKEALWKAVMYADKCLEYRDTIEQDARLLKAKAYLELENIRETLPDIKGALLDAVLSTENGSKEEHLDVILRYSELNNDYSFLNDILKNDKYPPLSRARAALLRDKGQFGLLAKKAIKATGNFPFSHPDWEDLRRLVVRAAKENASGWKDVAQAAWEVCVRNERMIYHNLHIRWYWSMQRDFYDLAFHAADTIKKKAEIADSVKGRPAYHWQLLEKMDKKAFSERIKQYEAGFMGRFAKGIASTRPPKGAQEEAEMALSEVSKPPKPWIAVHLYISHLNSKGQREDQGWALIADSEESGGGIWKRHEFNPKPIWDAYWTWQENYQRAGKEAAAELGKLCRVIGKEMGFLFDSAFLPVDRPIVFIPYDFLHKLPLHAAIQKQNGVLTMFAASHPSCYLPAWWYWKNPSQPDDNQPPLALIKWDNWDTHPGEHPLEKAVTQLNGTIVNPAKSNDLLKVKQPPTHLLLVCHGEANQANPFHSRLRLADQGPILAELLAAPSCNITGSQVILSVCETDLMPPISTPLDEHLTLSNALLQKGAGLVVGALWLVDPSKADLLSEKCLNDREKPIHNVVREWSGGMLSRYLTNPVNTQDLYLGAAFRVLGFRPSMNKKG